MEEEILENLNNRLDEAIDRGRRVIDEEELNEQLKKLKSRAEHLIRQHPIKSVATGLLAGYIIGKLFRSED